MNCRHLAAGRDGQGAGGLAPALVRRRGAPGDFADHDYVVDEVEVVEHPLVADTQPPAEELVTEALDLRVDEGVTGERP